ncbi:hypothetical protein Tco_1464780, partial [Tanacetum coccineum]
SYEHYEGIGAEVEPLEPGFEFQRATMESYGSFWDHMGAKDCCLKGYSKKRGGASLNGYTRGLFILVGALEECGGLEARLKVLDTFVGCRG